MRADTIKVCDSYVVEGLQDARLAGEGVKVILLVDVLESLNSNRPARAPTSTESSAALFRGNRHLGCHATLEPFDHLIFGRNMNTLSENVCASIKRKRMLLLMCKRLNVSAEQRGRALHMQVAG
jgi:hypothetical protein